MESQDIKETKDYTKETKDYINILSEIEKKALEIARSQLESSFDIEKSIGYLEWSSKNKVFPPH